ncbi:MAG: tetratricopeptide repeat protein [Bacteroidia bacterium]|nr:tetratricopeptide repeat protein [Bacteroidia bacterium]
MKKRILISTKQLKKNPKYYEVYFNEGATFLKEGKKEEAYNSFSLCIEITPYYKALFARAILLTETKQYTKAINDLDLVIKEKPALAKAWFQRALCKDEAGRIEESLADYNTAIQLSPTEALYFLNRAMALGKLNRIQESITDLNSAVEIKPDYAKAYYLRAIGKYRMKENPCEDFIKADQLGYPEAAAAVRKLCGR